MKLSICDKTKKDLFVALFQTIKNFSSIVCIIFKEDHLYIQGMDKSHVCLYDVKIFKQWFQCYEYNSEEPNNICVDSYTFHTIISKTHEAQCITLHYHGLFYDVFNIDLECKQANNSVKGDFNKYFKIPLIDFDNQLVNIPDADYDAEFIMNSKKICEITTQMLLFGSDIVFKCDEEKINLIANGTNGEMLVNIPIEDLTEYSIVEGGEINLLYSLNYIYKMCLTNKLSNEIVFYISEEYPMKIQYDLGDESYMIFFIAPKISND